MHRARRPTARTDRRLLRLAPLAAALLAIAVIVACSEKEPLTIGFLGGLSGRVADLGIAGRDGALLAVEQRNAAGGVGGRRVQLVAKDDAQDPDAARRGVRDLLAAGVPAIVGPLTSSVAMAVVPLVDESAALLVSPTVTTTRLSGLDDRFLRVSSTTREYATRLARYLAERTEARRAVLVLDRGNAAYTRSWAGDFAAAFTGLGGTIAGEVAFSSGDREALYDVARRVAAYDADTVVIAAGALDAALLCQQFAKLGGERRVAVSEWAATEQFLDLGGAAVEGVVADQFFDRDSTLPSYLAFRDAYRQRFAADPGFASVAAFDAANLVLDALAARRQGEDLKQTILRLGTVAGVQGPVALDRFGDANRPTHLSVVRGGAFRPLE